MIDYFARMLRLVTSSVRGGVRSIVTNLSLALLAVALAVSLWLFVTEQENPTQAETFNSAIPVTLTNVPPDLAVANTSASTVRIRIEGPENDLETLTTDDFEATVDLAQLSAGTAAVSVDVAPPNQRINVINVTPARIDVTLEPLRSKDVPVEVRPLGSPQDGFAVTGQESDPGNATVSGADSLVQLVESVVAEAPVADRRSDFSGRLELHPRDAAGGEISRVRVEPETAQVTVNIEQLVFTQPFVISPTISGRPADGYNVTAVTVDPPIVTVSGTRAALESIDAVAGIATEEISIADSRADVVRPVTLQLPEGAEVAGDDAVTVTVTVAISPARGEATFLVAPDVRNVSSDLTVTPPPPIAVTLAGEAPTLNALSTDAIIAFVDAQGLGPGIYALPITVTPPAGTTVVRVEPAEAGIGLVPRQQ